MIFSLVVRKRGYFFEAVFCENVFLFDGREGLNAVSKTSLTRMLLSLMVDRELNAAREISLTTTFLQFRGRAQGFVF